ncbi:facilitated trehalose transporter Tret1-like [Chelonus insularis]|uniref:facilitated trehalose transporter Tret1-like n=1 Tax=Chelonus insularis TaxID=460826 RepID=UPI0015895E08|nr:facilitated trehalose transporter Tret1-like [Chelonus insularis]
MASPSEIDTTTLDNYRPKRLNQHLGAIFASLSGFALGVSLGWNSSAGDTFRNVLNATGTEIGLVGGILNAGACGGIVMLPYILKFVSRITSILLTIPIYVTGWLLICLADQKVWSLMFGRFLCGVAGGSSCVLVPLFIAEIADKNSRTRLLIYFQLLINCGIFYAFLTTYLLNEQDSIWRYSVTCAISCAPIVLVATLPESPLYYLTKKDNDGALKSLKWYRGEGHTSDEIEDLQTIIKTRNSSLQIIKNCRVKCAIIVCYGVIITQQLSGVNVLIFYATVIFNNSGSGELSGSQQTLVVGIVQIISSALCMILIDFLGRRILLTISGIFMGLFMMTFGWYSSVRDNDPQYYDETFGWIPPACMILYFFAFNIGLGPISWSILGDIFPNEIKTVGAASAAFLSWLISLIATMTFGELAESLGISKTMWLFGGSCCLGGIFCGIFVRDTKHMSLADIQQKFAIDPTEVTIN